MPIYEYQCKECNAVFDCVTMRISEKVDPACEKCGSKKVAKLVSRVRTVTGPKEEALASSAEQRLLKSMGGKVDEKTRGELKTLAKQAAKRGKKRFDHMMATGKSENLDY